VETPRKWPDGTDLDTLKAWASKAEEAETRTVGDNPHYRMWHELGKETLVETNHRC
jgi:hypothetical protein